MAKGFNQEPLDLGITGHELLGAGVTVIDLIAHDLNHVRDNTLAAADATGYRNQSHGVNASR